MEKKRILDIPFLSLSCQTAILQKGYEKELKPSEYFSKEGTYPKEIGLIVSGLLRIYFMLSTDLQNYNLQ